VTKHQMAIDPGLGFGKRREQNSEIIARLEQLRVFDVPILIGPSRKSFLKKEDDLDTEFATAAAVAASILHGAHIVRVHDVKSMKAVVEVTDAIAHAREQEEEPAPAPRQRINPAARSGGEEPIRRLQPRLREVPPHQGR